MFDEVVILLCNHGCKALRDFRERENEIKFRAWLRVVCNRKADAYIRKNYVPMLIESEAGEVQNFLMGFEIDDRWQLYEEHVAFLRMNKKNKKQNIERDINIFKLYVWACFTDSMIKSTPCLKEIGPRVVDLVVNRTRQFLRESAKKNINKRESY